jgi:aminoglycoside phosphotransferase (APT) family kinase protein
MAIEDVSPGRSGTEEPVDVGKLEAYLRNVQGLREALPIQSVELIPGGQSNLTFRIGLTGRRIILRRPPLGPLPPSAHDVLREYRVMQGLARSAVPVPDLILACSDPNVIGAPFYLMEELPGGAIRFRLPPSIEAAGPEARRSIGEQVVDTLAALHTTDPGAAGLADLGKPTGYLTRQLRRWNGQLDYARVRPVPNLDWTAEWLERNLPANNLEGCIVHGDYKLDNVLFTLEPPPRLLAVVDWEMATLGDPLADLGWLLAFWCENGTPPRELTILSRVTELPGFPGRGELAERYAEHTGRSLPDLRFYIVFALWKMAVLLEGHWARHVRGTAGSFDFTYLETGGPTLAAYIRETAETG